ncbi:MAG: hypothetical protein J6K58_11450 [Lachnospiraceae bacterium]|nr:hypothetical protein [Lachnospiraceae bacterium]
MKSMKKYILAIILGLVVGVLTLVGQKYLPMNLNFLANSGAVWLIPAFLLSYFEKGNRLQAIATSIVCLLGCVYGYYIFEAVLNHHAFTLARGTLLWSGVALIAGAVFGSGAFFANQENSKLKYFGMNLLPAVFTAEGLDNVIHIKDYSHMVPAVIMKIIIGVILYLVINRKDVIRRKNIISYVVITALGVVAFAVLFGGI